MSIAHVNKVRGTQILRLLFQHGPLSHRAIQRLIEPEIKPRRLQAVTKRLREQGLIHRRYDSLPDNVGHVIELSQTQAARIGHSIGVFRVSARAHRAGS